MKLMFIWLALICHMKSFGVRSSFPPFVPLEDFLARVMIKDEVVCSGLIVNRKEVLTSSHCVLGVEPTELLVKLIDNSTTTVEDSKESSEYAVNGAADLLTLVQLSTQLDERYSTRPPICTGTPKPFDEVELWIWDNTENHVVARKVSTMSAETCMSEIRDPDGTVINNSTVCLKNTQKSVDCMPNFGLPYVWQGSFCGMNILGHNCPSPSNADVYVQLHK
ncbi:hypothetical protein KR009_011304 [Drosophila setifemur]|nr:hypothetical protein KR009_011304 [Drosophila setifemur]